MENNSYFLFFRLYGCKFFSRIRLEKRYIMKADKKNKNVFSKEELLSKDICPDCWDEMAYYNEYMTFVEDRTKTDLHGPDSDSSNKAFIEDFVQDNITGIKLKNDHNRRYCPTCEHDFLDEPEQVDAQKRKEK